jgi:CheY-like chemotaxis protein
VFTQVQYEGVAHPMRNLEALNRTVTRPERKSLRMVVVDDSKEFIELVRCVIAEAEHEIEVVGFAADGAEALCKVSEMHPDLVLMDVEMPLMNGLVAARLIRRRYPETRVILMSAESEYHSQARASGAFGFVYKRQFVTQFAHTIANL